ncbi:hypothetical protein YQE_00857, partial [Dendroctonus ponderosae]
MRRKRGLSRKKPANTSSTAWMISVINKLRFAIRMWFSRCSLISGQVNVPTDLEGGQLLAEKVDRKEFIDLLKRMLTMDQERRTTPGEALNHAFVRLAHLIDYAHCNNVKASVQMMEVCRRSDNSTTATAAHHPPAQQAPSLVANFVPSSNGNVTFTINNQLTNQVQRLVRDRPAYDNLPPILSQPGQQQYVPVSVVEPSGRQMLLTVRSPLPVELPFKCEWFLMKNAVQTSWPTTRQQMAIVPSWQQLPPQHATIQQPLLSEAEWGRPLLVDSSAILQEQRPVFNVDVTAEVYNPTIMEHAGTWGGSKRSSRAHYSQQAVPPHNHHHLMVPSHHRSQHDKKEQTQLSPVKKRVKEGTPPSEPCSSSRRSNASNGSWPHQVTSQDHHTQTYNTHQGHHHGPRVKTQNIVNDHTITINDTPSPAQLHREALHSDWYNVNVHFSAALLRSAAEWPVCRPTLLAPSKATTTTPPASTITAERMLSAALIFRTATTKNNLPQR